MNETALNPIGKVQSINIEHVPDEFSDELREKLSNSGGDLVSVRLGDDKFSEWLVSKGFVFDMPKCGKSKTWAWLVVFH